MEAPSLVWVQKELLGKVYCSAAGKRDTLIISSEAPLPHPDAVPRCRAELTEDDRRSLTNQGIPEHCCDDLSIVRSRCSLDKGKNVVGVEVSGPEKMLSRDYVLKQIASLMNNTTKPGVVIYYFGNGKKNTGDWCFHDGYITFKDIISLYSDNVHFRGHVLTIVSDCSYSGNWINACCEYLDEQGVKRCGHSVQERGIPLKVYTSCRPGEIAATPCFSVRAATNDKNTGCIEYKLDKELRDTQHSYGFDFTQVTCKQKNIEEPCALPPETGTWLMRIQGPRIYLVRGKDRGRPAWHYVLLVDDEETKKKFFEKITSGTVDVADYGEIVKSGWGVDPPNQLKDELEKKYSVWST